MLSFRQKIFLSYFLIFIIFTLLLYPVVYHVINRVQENNLRNQTRELIAFEQSASDMKTLIASLRQKEPFLFFRISLYDPREGFIYDSHDDINQEQKNLSDEPEIAEALKKGSGHDVRYSPLFGQDMSYVALAFNFQGQKYVLRTSFPNGQIQELTHDYIFTFLSLALGVLLAFCLLAWLIIHYLTRPVKLIINAIRPYQLGKTEHIPEIKISKEFGSQDEFENLAQTFNSLSKRIEQQIATLIQERNDKIAILESLGEGVIAVDREMNVVYVNHLTESFLGMSRDQLVGKNFADIKQPQCYQIISEAQLKKVAVTTILKPEGKPKRYLDVIAVPRGSEGTIVVLQDTTSLHKVIELGRDFIANASHELKTPITIIRGFAETLHDHPELPLEVSKGITEKIVKNCQRMDILVKNLLTLAAIDEGLPKSRLQECDLSDLVQQAKQTVLDIYHTASIDVITKGEPPFTLLADGDLFLQALLNLLDNAVKYSKPPAKVIVHIEKKAEEFVIQISDQGIGIPQEDLDRIFERFYVVDKSHSRSLGGSGLGLSIVERIVEKHQGRIHLESTLGKGTTFTLIFPIEEEEEKY